MTIPLLLTSRRTAVFLLGSLALFSFILWLWQRLLARDGSFTRADFDRI
jgi:hypothetical protein